MCRFFYVKHINVVRTTYDFRVYVFWMLKKKYLRLYGASVQLEGCCKRRATWTTKNDRGRIEDEE